MIVRAMVYGSVVSLMLSEVKRNEGKGKERNRSEEK